MIVMDYPRIILPTLPRCGHICDLGSSLLFAHDDMIRLKRGLSHWIIRLD